VTKFDENRGRGSKANVEIIALNFERFVSFEMLYLRFIDSCQFLNAWLEALIDSLVKSCDEPFDKLKHSHLHMGSDELLDATGVFPCHFFDSLNKFRDTLLPLKDDFYNSLTMEEISGEEYSRVQRILNYLDCHTFKDYHDLYLKSDVLLLTDVFENFRETGMSYYGLDPLHSRTLPSYSFDSCLKYVNVELDLLTDPEMHL
jgi:hypothetical protein